MESLFLKISDGFHKGLKLLERSNTCEAREMCLILYAPLAQLVEQLTLNWLACEGLDEIDVL